MHANRMEQGRQQRGAVVLFNVYLRNGVKSCWVVSPPFRTVTVLLPDGREEVFHRGVAKDPETEISADLAKVFS